MNKMVITYDNVHSLSRFLYLKIFKEFKPDRIIGIARGGLLPGVILSHMFNRPFTTLHWTTRDFPKEDHEILLWVPEDIEKGEKILVVDDICDTGKTFEEVYADWRTELKLSGWEDIPSDQVKSASLFKRHTSTFEPDYCASVLENDRWVVFPYEQP